MDSIKSITYLALFLFSFTCLSQTKTIVLYNEDGTTLTKEQFLTSSRLKDKFSVYYENDTIKYGIVLNRIKFGTISPSTFSELKNYLTQLSGTPILEKQNIVINYLNKTPLTSQNKQPKSSWNVLDRDYTKGLHRIADIRQFWIYHPETDELDYYQKNNINWISDTANFFKSTFFPFDVRYANYLLIKPDGSYFYQLSEHSKYTIWDRAKSFF
ncbi:hypothetical protein [Bizionia paragorgiae]|uniref:hypothetical protein n=1 Tax=Bizionia paragorgiae TaxID=283786 RepID=UPI00299EBC0B|nr:hypothetical protein [Bizionia paragorgiae]MDX1272588.1 hypothetical protein [Bizionia paragorgiae]